MLINCTSQNFHSDIPELRKKINPLKGVGKDDKNMSNCNKIKNLIWTKISSRELRPLSKKTEHVRISKGSIGKK